MAIVHVVVGLYPGYDASEAVCTSMNSHSL